MKNDYENWAALDAGKCQPNSEVRHDVTLASASRKVLVVDDNRLLLETICNILSFLGYVPIEASDADSALTLLEQHPDIFLMVCDVELSESSNGLDLGFRATHLQPELKVLFISGRPDYEQMHPLPDNALFMLKPFKKADLKTKIENLMLLTNSVL